MDKGNCQTTFEKICRKTYLWNTALLLFEFKTREELDKSLIVVSNGSTTFVFLSTLDNIALIAESEMASFLPFPWNSLHFSSEKKKEESPTSSVSGHRQISGEFKQAKIAGLRTNLRRFSELRHISSISKIRLESAVSLRFGVIQTLKRTRQRYGEKQKAALIQIEPLNWKVLQHFNMTWQVNLWSMAPLCDFFPN